jgi:large subunit ribosomal protein L17
MRHGKKINHLGRKTAHREAMLSNMACSLIEHKRINTTVAKAKALRKYVEPLITKSKTDSTHSRRVAFSTLRNKEAVTELFREVGPKVASRPGGYTRIIRTETRIGDNAEMCLIELVDFNELLIKETKTKTRRSRRSGSGKASEAGAPAAAAAKAKAPVASAPEEDVAEVGEELKGSAMEVSDKAAQEVAEEGAEVKDNTEASQNDTSDSEKKDEENKKEE